MSSPPVDPQHSRSAAMPILTILCAMLGLIAVINMTRADDQTAISASGAQANVLGFTAPLQPDTDAVEGADSIPTSVPTTAPIEIPTVTPTPTFAVEPAAVVIAPTATTPPATATPTPSPTAPPDVASKQAERQSDVAAPSVPATATAVPPTATAVAPTPTMPASPTATPPPPTSTPLPTPQPTATNEPTPQPTATPTLVRSIPDMESWVLGEINRVRANAGLAPVQLRSDISAIARDWSQQMAAVGGISHRPQNQLSAMLPAGWALWAENVAEAPSIEWAQSALEQSPGHYANMTGDYNVVGVGIAVASNGQIFVTHNFAKY